MMGAHQQIGMPHMPAVASVLGRFDRTHLEAFMEVAVGLLDVLDAPDDPDEPNFASRSDGAPGDPGDHEPGGDEEGGAYVEWTTKPGSHRRRGNPETTLGHEDAEDDDPAEEDDPPGVIDEDGVNTITPRQFAGLPIGDGPGCIIADDDGESMGGDVPSLQVHSLDHNLFTDKRELLGIGNLQSSFIGQNVRSADTGALHSTRAIVGPCEPGVPV